MPQTVPSGFYIVPENTYAVYAENFDLSLLPVDGEVPLSPQSQFNAELSLLSSDYIPATIFHDTPIKLEKESWSSDSSSSSGSPQPSSHKFGKNSNLPTTEISQQFQYYSTETFPSPPHDQFLTVFPPSPAPSIELTPRYQPSIQFNIKQECVGLYPPSPPDSNGAPSPRCCDIKGEPDTSADESDVCLDFDSLLQNSFEVLEPKKQPHQDHQLLREYLQDTSFQRKHNLKPLALESLLGGWGTRGDIEPVISLALEHAKKDVLRTCATLNISPGEHNSFF